MRVRVPFQVERSGFREPGFSLPLFFFFYVTLVSPTTPPRFLPPSRSRILPSRGKGVEGGREEGRRALIRADGVSFHEYWPSTVSLAPYRFARDIARVLCRSLARASVPFVHARLDRSPAHSRVCEIRGVTAGSEIEAVAHRALSRLFLSLSFLSSRPDRRGLSLARIERTCASISRTVYYCIIITSYDFFIYRPHIRILVFSIRASREFYSPDFRQSHTSLDLI